MGERLKKKGSLLFGLFVVLVAICFWGTAAQTLTRLNGHPLLIASWWLLKVTSAAATVLVPMLLGSCQHFHRQRAGTTILIWTIGALAFGFARYTSQPAVRGIPSPELFVVQNIFIAWLAGTLLYLFATPLQDFFHRWPIAFRRHFLLGGTLLFFLLRLVSAYDLFGFHGGTSLIWFLYLFALGDWLANDCRWLKKRSARWYAAAVISSSLITVVVTWLNMNHVIYSPHRGLTPDTHYLLAINTCQPLFAVTCILIVAWLIRSGFLIWNDDYRLVQGLLLLNLLGLPQAVTPLLLPSVNAMGAVAGALVSLGLLFWLPLVLVRWGAKHEITISWRSAAGGLRRLCLHYWPLAATYLILWLMTVASFAILWGNDPTMIQWVLTQRAKIITINVLIIYAIVLIIMALTNRWWLSSGIGIILYFAWLVASELKMAARNEPILPTDLSVIAAPKEMLGMVSTGVLAGAGIGIVLLLAVVILLERRVGKETRFNGWWRGISIVAAAGFLASFGLANHSDSLTYKQLQQVKDIPYFYSQYRGARMNGTLLQFANNVDVHVMNKPAGYSRARMNKIEHRYQQIGRQINRQRTHQTVRGQNLVFVLSESFADPQRVPGLKTSGDPLPFLHRFKRQTTSGLMLSSGYGGGTANMEYQALTGLSIANFSPTMPTPYSQLVPFQKRTFTINNLFNYSIGLHPFSANLYSRKTVYRKFGFNKFYHFDGGSRITYTSKIQHNSRVSDDATYHEIDLDLHRHPHGKFIQVATMQNHMPYKPTYYDHHEFRVRGRAFANADQRAQIETYIQGIHYTDGALRTWIHRVDKLKQPTTIVWYGDHLPGIYHGLSMTKYGVPLHETDYFIYSNRAARRQNHDRLRNQHQLVSPNDFAAMALAKMDVKVSPYYALLTEVLEKLPAVSLPTNGTAKNNTAHQGGTDFINQQGRHVELTAGQQRLFHDYQLVQYDLTAGHHYLLKNSFLKQPAK